MATPVPPRCDADHNFCDDSERFRKAAAGGLLAFRCIRPSAVRNGHAPMLLLRARPRLLPNARQLGGEVSSRLIPEMPSNEPGSFALDVRGFEDRPPLLDLGL